MIADILEVIGYLLWVGIIGGITAVVINSFSKRSG